MLSIALLLVTASLVPAACRQDVTPQQLQALALRCGTEVNWATRWSEAESRSRQSGKPILVVFHAVSGFNLPDPAMIGPFMDTPIIELANSRFVPMRMDKSTPAPFREPQGYGMGPFAFGTSILVVTGDGQVVADTFTTEGTALLEFLVAQAQKHSPAGSAPADLQGVELASWHLAAGNRADAQRLLEQDSTAEAQQVQAGLYLQLRRGDDALKAIEAARVGGATESDLAVAEASAQARLDRFDEARTCLDAVTNGHSDYPDACMLRAALDQATGDLTAAMACYQQVVTDHAEHRQAPLAAMMLLSRSILENVGATGSLAWPPEEKLAALDHGPFQRTTSVAIGPSMRDAEAFLLASQRKDGSWASPAEVQTQTATARMPLTIATTALAARSLVPHASKPECSAAIQRALGFVRQARLHTLQDGDPFGVMDYTVWSKTCLLLFLSEAMDSGHANEADWAETMDQLIAEMGRKQKSGGGWSYYMGGDVNNLDPNLDVSFSFVTAFVLMGLRAAEDAGFEVPEEVSSEALSCLERMGNPDGSYEYSMLHANEDAPRTPMPAGAAGRGPLCTLALYRWDRADLADVKKSLDIFLLHRASYAREHGKSIMHCGAEGQGSHYLMFDYAWAAEACAALPAGARIPYRDAVLDQVRNARLASGAYLDNPLLGDRFGAAAGLWALRRLIE